LPPYDFGTLKYLDLRSIWPKEAADFTPWLAENLTALGEVLGMDLELQSSEAPVGGFSLDLLARDLGRDHLVVIENQLEVTNHDHLGKLLTYAAGYDAGAVVWIAKELREEHRQALDWLNQHTDSAVAFYGVVVEVLQIDSSRPTFNFRLVAFPNEWRKGNIGLPEAGPKSERAEAYQTFFQSLIDELREKHHFTGAKLAQPANWYSFSSGRAGIHYNFVFRAGGKVRADVTIGRGDKTLNKEWFKALEQEKNQIEQAFGETLSWERLDDQRDSRIAIYRPGSIEDDSQTLEEIKAWAVTQLLRLKNTFGPRLSKLVG
jgi:hypothetical protein